MEKNLKITEVLAIYAALLSTVVFVWNIARGIPRYKVDLIYGTTEDEGDCKFGVYISVRNPSSHTVHLSNISLLYPYRSGNLVEKLTHVFKYRRMPTTVGWCYTSLSNYEVDHKCPVALEPGKSHDVFIPENIIEQVLSDCSKREIKAVVQDQLWRNKYSLKFDYPRRDENE